jgi:hypothetical protein
MLAPCVILIPTPATECLPPAGRLAQLFWLFMAPFRYLLSDLLRWQRSTE